MSRLSTKIRAEEKVRTLLAENDMPAPDAVEYGYGCIRLFWKEQKVALIIDLEEDADAPADFPRRTG